MTRRVKRILAVMLAALMLWTAPSTAFAAQEAGTSFSDDPGYCLYCGETHTGASGFFVSVGHKIAYFFCSIFGRTPDRGHMQFSTVTVDAGASEPFTFLHISDTHLAFADDRDDAQKKALSDRRVPGFPRSLRMLDDATAKADELGCFIVHTGDLIDFVSKKNLELSKAFVDSGDVIVTAGNHEYSLYIWGDKEDAAQRASVEADLQSAFRNNVHFYSRRVKGVNIIAIDNGYYRVEQWQLDAFKKELERGLPVILCLHVPLYAPDIRDYSFEAFGLPYWLMSVPEEEMKDYDEGSYEHQKEDAITHEFFELIKSSPSIKAIFCGHMHFDYVSQVTPTLKQYVTSCESGRIVEVK